MPDGTRLAARIWLPVDAETDPVPAILEYLPYRKRDGTVERDHLTHPYFAGHGYAGVRVDIRGTGDSEGVCLGEYLKQEQDDCLTVIEWLAAQPWCSGKVGMIGISWGGFNGLQVAARRPEALGAVVSLCSTDDRYADDIHFMGGCMLTDKLSWGATAFSICNTPPDPAIVGDRWREMWIERLEGNGLWMLDWFRHQRRDKFYAHGSVCENYADIEVPVYAVGGWADGYTNAIFRLLEHLPGPKKGLIGPWAHKYPHFAKPGPRIGFLQECLRWWDQHLKGIETGIMEEPELRAWINFPGVPSPRNEDRSGRWVAEPEWNGSRMKVLSLCPGENGLADEPSRTAIALSSAETAGWTSGAWCGYGAVPDGPLDQNGEAGLMTVFETDVLDQEFDLFGFPQFHAEIASVSHQANLAAVLSAVGEDGRATLVSYGALNLAHRASHASPERMPLAQPQPVTIELNACGQRVGKGQRLRLALSTALWPVIWPSNEKATLRIEPGSARLDLPVRPRRDSDEELAPFPPPEGASPAPIKQHSRSLYDRRRDVDLTTGGETYSRSSSAGPATHMHTGLTVKRSSSERFHIHPEDPNSAIGTCRWCESYSRDGWKAEVRTEVSVHALRDCWRIEASLVARDVDGIVVERQWNEDVPRDLV
ncbi:MAG: CocE/NonD family hydrolase [Boseongicola sp. SB0664_bin_43]|uniref:CocE/NonD family hydrolase n=1 Tax=Boseongicola sp. SB0664_bin_43 TaxID=2604844 RepID=A0A6B0Y0X1_9RHOB|nr:CocE/NonD family hydrolase [Boseongicola sp. SB0664_bin_43]MYK30213.1 CocE/NonD family hydrolase [Boseongicola sp. SB0670_bin_30]